MEYLDYEAFEAIDPAGYQAQQPYPWANPENLLRPEAFERLRQSLPEVALFQRSFGKARLATIPGVVPGVGDRPPGCLFAPRCPFVVPACEAAVPPLIPDGDGRVRCIRPLLNGLPQDGGGATRPELLEAEAPA